MVRDLTKDWQQEPAGNGLYVVRSCQELYRGVVRVGAAGIRGGRGGLVKRLNGHFRKRTGPATCGTHECNPFVLICAWALDTWSPADVASAEHCLYRAFAIKFPRRTNGLPDDSLFLVPKDSDLKKILTSVMNDLRAIENLRPH